MTLTIEDRRQLTQTITTWLGETKPGPVYHLSRIVGCFGKERVFALLQKTLEAEAAGGLQTVKGTRRTIGGVFFSLAKQECTPEELQILFPTPTWKQTHAKKKRAQVHETEKAQAQEAENKP